MSNIHHRGLEIFRNARKARAILARKKAEVRANNGQLSEAQVGSIAEASLRLQAIAAAQHQERPIRKQHPVRKPVPLRQPIAALIKK